MIEEIKSEQKFKLDQNDRQCSRLMDEAFIWNAFENRANVPSHEC